LHLEGPTVQGLKRTALILALLQAATGAWAQSAKSPEIAVPDEMAAEPSDGAETGDVEALYDKYDTDQVKKKETRKKEEAKKAADVEATNLSDLAALSPFADIAVIERKFLPRTGRFEISGSGMTSVNNPYFNNIGVGLRGAYFLTEKHGIEFEYSYFSNSARSVTKNLENDRGVTTDNLVTSKSYYGVSYKWVPVYGKVSFMNQQILPFDLFFNVGLGMTSANKKSEPTLYLDAGQSFAISKRTAFRWDINWSFFQPEVDDVAGGGSSRVAHNDLFLSLGMSFFFPEATYR
jgi:outer membrane beta-barrel protein